MRIQSFLLFVILTTFCEKSVSQYPSVPCPNIFRYVRVYDLDVGLITLENVQYGETELEIELSQHGSVSPGMEGYINLNTEENKILDYIRTGTPITYQVNFPLRNVVPHVSAIKVNGDTVCYGHKVSAPSTTITLTYTLRASNHRGHFRPTSSRHTPQYPSVPCPNIFQYVRVDDQDMGLITIDSLPYGVNVLEVELSQAGSIYPGNKGHLNLNIDQNEVYEYLRTRRPITYKVNFPLKNVVPLVSAITINGNEICYGQRVSGPSTTITLRHRLTAPLPHNTDSGRNIFMPPMHSHGPAEIIYSTPHSHATTTERPYYTTEETEPTSTSTFTTTLRPTTTSTSTVKPEGPATLQYINSVCGRENSNLTTTNKLAADRETMSRARFPWIVAIFKKEPGTLSFQCGGSLISTRTVISAAHCFFTENDVIKSEDILISMGRHNLTDWTDSYISHCDVEKTVLHPDYRPELADVDVDADLAIILLKRMMRFSHEIRPVCLWQGPAQVRDIVGVSGIVVGWGRDASNSNAPTSPRLVRANLDSCKKSNQQMIYLTSNRTLCANSLDGNSPCNGDSGSGLMMQNGNKWMLRGTVSAAIGTAVNQCSMKNYVVYTDVAMYIEWIQENMLL